MKRPISKAISYFFRAIGLLAVMSGTPETESYVREGLGFWLLEGEEFRFTNLELNRQQYSQYSVVMVSFNPGSSFSKQLYSAPSTLAFYTSFEHRRGRAIVQVSSPLERDQLASLAHEDIQACGAVEQLYPSLTTTSLGDASSPIIPTSIQSTSIASLVSAVSSVNISATVASFESLGSRYHASSSPNVASDLVKTSWTNNLPAGAVISQPSHSTTTQKSVVLKIPGTDPKGKTVIIGAHLDSINLNNNNNAPGADDDASGIAALTEILRVLKSSAATFSRPIEFHAYAAEEVGLLGSYELAMAASGAGQSIAAMLQLDMVGYTPIQGKQTIHLVTTDTSPVLVRHMKDLLSGYLGGDWETGELHAGTSDHRAWYRTGVHTAFAFEDPVNYNHALHTEADKSDRIDFSLAARFAKLGVAFLAHEAGLTAASSETSTAWAYQKATSAQVKLAISKSGSGGLRLSAAVADSLKAQSAELCKLSAGTENGCQSLVTGADLAPSKNGRSFFVSSSDIPLASGDIWRFHLYDAAGGLLALRTVKLTK